MDDHDRGLEWDLPRLMGRRRMLGVVGGAALATLSSGCGDGGGSTSARSATPSAVGTAGGTVTATAGSGGKCAELPEETAGPFPGDGSNGPNVLTGSGVVRSDITSSFGSASGRAEGIRVTVELTIQNSARNCEAYAGAAVYLWHCDAQGRYSMYSEGVTDQNYLRGVQAADGNGRIQFTSIFPACYDGRWPHMHFEVYPSTAKATSASGRLLTSQLALPQDVCEKVYATSAYSGSAQNLSKVSLTTDMVFSDGYRTQMATVTGDNSAGYVVTLDVPV